MRRRLATVGIAIVPVLVAACGTTTLDSGQAEHQIESGIQRVTGKHVTASCPSSIPVAKGRVTDCKVTAADGTKATVRIVQTDNSGHVNISSPVVHTAEVEQNISASASGKLGFTVKVTCPELIQATAGTKFKCKATDWRGVSKTVTVTTQTARGGFSYTIG